MDTLQRSISERSEETKAINSAGGLYNYLLGTTHEHEKSLNEMIKAQTEIIRRLRNFQLSLTKVKPNAFSSGNSVSSKERYKS